MPMTPRRPTARLPTRATSEQDIPQTLDALIEDRASRLTAYANQEYADRYRTYVASIRTWTTRIRTPSL